MTIDNAREDILLAQELVAGTSSSIFMHSTTQGIHNMLKARDDGKRYISAIGELWRSAPDRGQSTAIHNISRSKHHGTAWRAHRRA